MAGLVGVGLSRLFVAHGDEGRGLATDVQLSVDMGTFLQVRAFSFASLFILVYFPVGESVLLLHVPLSFRSTAKQTNTNGHACFLSSIYQSTHTETNTI